MVEVQPKEVLRCPVCDVVGPRAQGHVLSKRRARRTRPVWLDGPVFPAVEIASRS